ncbi:hypothetical protein BD410DRAFT_765221 [Rickenella mellea]|uniref:very-long-chain enoyl-CoA reductase n=1 Tax=Rickenella mellea TaxID=50990 RepID=A0A4Y7QDD9_9AGAM|nr:hypothetical protein BD410DRAFT_765221 [Rickenella mellea]
MVSVTISSSRPTALARGLPIDVEIPGKTVEDATIADVKSAILAKFPKFSVERQKITLEGEKKALGDELTFQQAGVLDGGMLNVKDLGPQISWRTVFLVEYGGPLIIHPLIYYFPEVFYGGPVRHSQLQTYVYALVMLHFIKREAETLFVHRFSHATMPFGNIFKNSAHYHLLSGIALAWAVYGPKYAATSPLVIRSYRSDPNTLNVIAALWAFAEVSNLIVHLNLRSLRPAGTRRRAVPHGYGFNLVSCPNYLFEILAWVAIALMTNNIVAWIFVVVSTYQMTVWAIKKHKGYKKEFGNEYPRGRKVVIPFIF